MPTDISEKSQHQIDTMEKPQKCVEISLSTDSAVLKLRAGNAKEIPPVLFSESAGFHIVFIRSSRSLFCSSVSGLHLENRMRCSSVSCAGSSPSAKNWAKVMPNALQTDSKVGSVGALFLLNIFVITPL